MAALMGSKCWADIAEEEDEAYVSAGKTLLWEQGVVQDVARCHSADTSTKLGFLGAATTMDFFESEAGSWSADGKPGGFGAAPAMNIFEDEDSAGAQTPSADYKPGFLCLQPDDDDELPWSFFSNQTRSSRSTDCESSPVMKAFCSEDFIDRDDERLCGASSRDEASTTLGQGSASDTTSTAPEVFNDGDIVDHFEPQFEPFQPIVQFTSMEKVFDTSSVPPPPLDPPAFRHERFQHGSVAGTPVAQFAPFTSKTTWLPNDSLGQNNSYQVPGNSQPYVPSPQYQGPWQAAAPPAPCPAQFFGTAAQAAPVPPPQAPAPAVVCVAKEEAFAGGMPQGKINKDWEQQPCWQQQQQQQRRRQQQQQQQQQQRSGGHQAPEPTLNLMEVVPRDEHGQLTSVGSISHESGQCRPCLFFKTPIGCQKGTSCKFCHIWHKAGDPRRPCKAKRDRYKKLVTRVLATGAGGLPA